MTLEELEFMRKENEERLKMLEEVYNRKKENSGVGRVIREKMGFKEDYEKKHSPKNHFYSEREDEEDDEAF